MQADQQIKKFPLFSFTDCDKRVKPTRHDNRPVAQLKKNVKGHNGGK